MFIARDIEKKLQGRTVVQASGLQLARGQIVGIIGPSGSGKTTLLRSLSLIEPPDAGTVEIDDQTYVFPQSPQTPPPSPWPRLTVVFQQLFLWPHLTLRENLLLPLRAQMNAERQDLLDEVIAFFDMADFLDRFPSQVSGGQKQRLALARAIALQPHYLLLDEITSALDVEQIHKILEFLLLVRDRGCGILLVTHHLNFARQAANEILFMDHGRIIERGPPSILDAPKAERFKTFVSHVIAAS
jgi:ABC-type polar amino acid transport system ATPase subunit